MQGKAGCGKMGAMDNKRDKVGWGRAGRAAVQGKAGCGKVVRALDSKAQWEAPERW